MDDVPLISFHLCPACFAREVDFVMHFDESAHEYYCTRCCYAGTLEEVQRFYRVFTCHKYKDEFGSRS